MEELENYLESATVHGLAYIGQTRKLIKVFWILIVLAGFIGAGFLINQSFANWQESPIKTYVETLPISEITFPKVTVCPPKNIFTNLNYELVMAENKTTNLKNHMDFIQENFQRKIQEFNYKMTMEDINDNNFKEEKGVRNWYMRTRYESKKIP